MSSLSDLKQSDITSFRVGFAKVSTRYNQSFFIFLCQKLLVFYLMFQVFLYL